MTEKSYATNVWTILGISAVLMLFIFLLVGHHYGMPNRVRVDRAVLFYEKARQLDSSARAKALPALDRLSGADPGWAEQYTVNGAAPQPVSEGSHDGKLVFVLGHIPRGTHSTFFLSLQVNPTNVGHRSQSVSLYDGARLLIHLRRTITIFP